MSKGGLGGMMKQVQEMQVKMQEMQAALEKAEVEGTAGGGMVKVVSNGKMEILRVTIDPEVIDKDDPDMLGDLIVAAVNQSRQKVHDLQQEKMAAITGGFNLPGLNLPF